MNKAVTIGGHARDNSLLHAFATIAMTDPGRAHETTKNASEARQDIADWVLSNADHLSGIPHVVKFVNEHDRLAEEIARCREKRAKLTKAREELAPLERLAVSCCKNLESAKSKLAKLARPLGVAAFEAFLADDIDESQVFTNRLAVQNRVRELQQERDGLDAAPESEMPQKAKAKALQLAVTGKIKLEEIKFRGLDTETGRKLIEANLDESIRCSSTADLLDRIKTQRARVAKLSADQKAANTELTEARNRLSKIVGLTLFGNTKELDTSISRCTKNAKQCDRKLDAATRALVKTLQEAEPSSLPSELSSLLDSVPVETNWTTITAKAKACLAKLSARHEADTSLAVKATLVFVGLVIFSVVLWPSGEVKAPVVKKEVEAIESASVAIPEPLPAAESSELESEDQAKSMAKSVAVPDSSPSLESGADKPSQEVALPETRKAASADGRKFIQSKYEELLAFRATPEFIEYGFAIGGPYSQWIKDVQYAHNTKRFGEGEAAYTITHLLQLGLEYVSSKGRETPFSKTARKRIKVTLTGNSLWGQLDRTMLTNTESQSHKHVDDDVFGEVFGFRTLGHLRAFWGRDIIDANPSTAERLRLGALGIPMKTKVSIISKHQIGKPFLAFKVAIAEGDLKGKELFIAQFDMIDYLDPLSWQSDNETVAVFAPKTKSVIGTRKWYGGGTLAKKMAAKAEADRKAAAVAAARAEEELDVNGLVLMRKSVSGATGDFGGTIKGIVENRRSRKLNYAQITFNLFDDSGAQVGSAIANINGLEPGGRWKFEANSFGKDFSTYKFSELKGF